MGHPEVPQTGQSEPCCVRMMLGLSLCLLVCLQLSRAQLGQSPTVNPNTNNIPIIYFQVIINSDVFFNLFFTDNTLLIYIVKGLFATVSLAKFIIFIRDDINFNVYSLPFLYMLIFQCNLQVNCDVTIRLLHFLSTFKVLFHIFKESNSLNT